MGKTKIFRVLRRSFRSARSRVRLSLVFSLGMNAFFAATHIVASFLSHSVFFCALFFYYLSLGGMRLYLLRATKEHGRGKNIVAEYRRYRHVGLSLLFTTLTLFFMVFYIVHHGEGFSYHPFLTVLMAPYTVYAVTFAIAGLVRYRKYQSPLLSATRAVSFATALFSVLSLTTAIYSAFSHRGGEAFRASITAFVGGTACIAVLAMSCYMIVHATRRIRFFDA